MKRKTLVLSLLVVLFCTNLFAQQVDQNLAKTISKNFIHYHQKSHEIESVQSLDSESMVLAWVVALSPDGFLLVSANENLRPVLAYSFQDKLTENPEEWQIFQTIIKSDIESRLAFPAEDSKTIQKIRQEWDDLISGTKSKTRYEQWPPEGTTPTGGWLFENWTQGSPYNQMCPIDGNTHQRSLAGCPATAMSMIVNCLMEINETQLFDSDDYYHSYGSGNQYWIDDDWANFGFPCFDSLNLYLDSIQFNYVGHMPLSTPQISALTFACGVSLKQVFTSSISGTFGIEQAADAFQRFGFADSRLVYDSDTSLQTDLAENIKTGWTAQLGLLSPPPNQVGHNVVVDGYNTDEYYHFNFGWGGNSNGWYTMPPTNIPYNLTVIEGIVMDIKGENPHVGIIPPAIESSENIEMLWIAASNAVKISLHHREHTDGILSVYSIYGRLIERQAVNLEKGCENIYTLKTHPKGIYLLQLTDGIQVNQVLKIYR